MTLNTSIIKEKLRTYVGQAIHADKKKLNDGTLLFREGYFDSMGFILLITFLEDEFKIKTGDEDLIEENFESINAMVDFVSRKIKVSLCAD